ncbi:MAG: hypothetical protein JEZ10_04600 [Verrucomicrobia bacterium]|nr:hypothetical protein [Verrucomicrobiota bacterium]
MRDKRVGRIRSKDHLATWLSSWWESNISEDFEIREFSINMHEFAQDKLWHAADGGNQSLLHVYLKWQMCKWMEEQFSGIRFEGSVYIVNEDESDELGYKFSIGGERVFPQSKILEEGYDFHKIVGAGFLGNIIRYDLIGEDVNAEVGFTTAPNLLAALTYNLVEKTYWVPFPYKVNEAVFDPQKDAFEKVTAYEFTPRWNA